MKKPSLLVVILDGFCAVIWPVRAVLDVVYGTYRSSPFLFVLNVLCALIWIVVFLVALKRYRSGEENG